MNSAKQTSPAQTQLSPTQTAPHNQDKSLLHMQENRSSRIRGILFALLGGTLWGFSGACGQFLFSFETVTSAWLTVVRMLVSGVILLFVSLCSRKQRASMKAIWRAPRDVLRLIAFSVLGLACCQYTYLTAIAHTNAGTATVLQYLGPAMIMLLSCVAALRLPSRSELLAVILAIGGTFLLATHGNPGSLIISKEGLFWGLASAVALVLYTMLPGNLVRQYGSTVVVGFGMLIGGLFLFVVLGFWRFHILLNVPMLLAIAAIILIGTALSYTLYLQSVSDIGSIRASMLACIEPVSATTISALWLGTSFAVPDILGLCLILSAVLLITKNKTA